MEDDADNDKNLYDNVSSDEEDFESGAFSFA